MYSHVRVEMKKDVDTGLYEDTPSRIYRGIVRVHERKVHGSS